MSSASIGIKLADNKFFPIMDDGVEGAKTLELTTVNESQESVQIHLYRSKESSSAQTVDSAEYIGTLIIEDIAKKPAGTPTIKLKISINGAGDLSAEALDEDSGMHQTLNVSLKDLSKESLEPLPDFDITGVESGEELDFSNLDDGALDDIGLEIENYPDAADNGALSFGEEAADVAEEAFADAPPEDDSFADNLDASFSDMIDLPESPDFESSDSAEEESLEPSVLENLYDTSETGRVKERKGVFVPAWACVLILVVGIALLAAALVFAWKFFSNSSPSSAASVAEASAAIEPARSVPIPQPAPEPPQVARQEEDLVEASSLLPPAPEQEPSVAPAQEEPTPPPVWQDEAAVVETAAPEPPAPPEPAPAPQNVYYLVKWGDTLWDLAQTYYRNPWRYSYIARYNGIRNPSLIVAGTYLVIPAE